MKKNDIAAFVEKVWQYYDLHSRQLPWRIPENDGSFSTYKILVSEFMLQQTQVQRVIPKYQDFIDKFPTIDKLAAASFSEVVKAWSGLGYNRRAKYLHDAAKKLSIMPFPENLADLTICKGVGNNTAAAILVYSFNKKVVFIETNIRTVVFYHFFKNANQKIADSDITPIVKSSLEYVPDNYREWYWALMDYGSHLKANGVKNVSQSKHYVKQLQFHGSERQIRGEILRSALKGKSVVKVRESINDSRFDKLLEVLKNEGLIQQIDGKLIVPD